MSSSSSDCKNDSSDNSEKNSVANSGVEYWKKVRQQWVQKTDKAIINNTVKAKSIDVEDVVEKIFSSNGAPNAPLTEPVPLRFSYHLIKYCFF